MSNLLLPDPAYEKTIFSGRLIKRHVITKNEARTFFLTLEFQDPVPYKSGDSFAIYPENSQEAVAAWCHSIHLDPHTPVTAELTAQDYLQKKVALTKWTSKMSQLIFNDTKLPEALKDLDPLDILKTLTLSKETALKLISILPPQMPRYYSIACSPNNHTRRMDLLVSLSSFETNGELKYGVASSYLCLEAPLDTQLHGFIHVADHFRIPSDDTPIIMIGPGTGIAPFRAFIHDRILNKHTKNWLFFGERNKASDFYFEEEFLAYQKDKKLRMSLAFSRDQAHKIYVQDLMLTHKQELYEWIKAGAIIYVCGDAKEMAKGVESAFISILSEYEAHDPKSALGQLRSWRKEKRYNLDVY